MPIWLSEELKFPVIPEIETSCSCLPGKCIHPSIPLLDLLDHREKQIKMWKEIHSKLIAHISKMEQEIDAFSDREVIRKNEHRIAMRSIHKKLDALHDFMVRIN